MPRYRRLLTRLIGRPESFQGFRQGILPFSSSTIIRAVTISNALFPAASSRGLEELLASGRTMEMAAPFEPKY